MKKKMNLLDMSKNELKELRAGATAGCECACLYSFEDKHIDPEFLSYGSYEDNRDANSEEFSSGGSSTGGSTGGGISCDPFSA